MKQKKLVIYFITIVMLLLAPLPILNTFINFIDGNLKSQSINKKNLFSTDNIEKYINYLVYKNFNKSLVPDSVIAGKDGFLFLGNKYAKVLDKTNGTYKPSKKEIDSWTNKLKKLQQWYEDRGIKFVTVIVPNKHSVYKEKLPNWMKYDGKTITDDIVHYSKKRNIHLLDLREALVNASDTKTLYMKTDTHWNNVGAAIGYDLTIEYIHNIYGIKLNKPLYTISDKYRNAGDLAIFLKIDNILDDKYENVYKFDYSYDNNVCNGDIDRTNYELKECKNIINPVMFINRTPQYMVNVNSLNKEKLLWLCDSFAGSGGGKVTNSQLYNATFHTIWKWHYSHINGAKLSKFISSNKPDIVIYQIAERSLYNQSIVNPPSKIKDTQSKKIINTQKSNANDKIIFNLAKKLYKNNQFSLKSINSGIEMNVINNDPVIILNNTIANTKNVILSYQIESPVNTKFQLFYKEKTSSKYNENDSYKVAIKKGLNSFNLLISSKYINNGLRVDLVSKKGKYIIKGFKIYDKK